MTLFAGLLPQYSRGAHPMQRGYRTWSRLAVDPVKPCARAEPDQAPESSARHSPDDSNAHSGPLVATETEAHVSQRSHEGGSDMLRVRHIPGNGIPRKTGSKRGWQRETQNTSWIKLILTLVKMQSCRQKARSQLTDFFLEVRGTCKAAIRHVKVRRRCYCESPMKSE